MPADMRLRVAMRQQEWIPAPAADEVNGGFLSVDLLTSETIKYGSLYLSVSGWPRPKALERQRQRRASAAAGTFGRLHTSRQPTRLPHEWHKTVPHPLLVFCVSGQIPGEEPFLLKEPPEQKGYHRGDRDKPPVRAQRQRRAEQVQGRTGGHRMAKD